MLCRNSQDSCGFCPRDSCCIVPISASWSDRNRLRCYMSYGPMGSLASAFTAMSACDLRRRHYVPQVVSYQGQPLNRAHFLTSKLRALASFVANVIPSHGHPCARACGTVECPRDLTLPYQRRLASPWDSHFAETIARCRNYRAVSRFRFTTNN